MEKMGHYRNYAIWKVYSKSRCEEKNNVDKYTGSKTNTHAHTPLPKVVANGGLVKPLPLIQKLGDVIAGVLQ